MIQHRFGATRLLAPVGFVFTTTLGLGTARADSLNFAAAFAWEGEVTTTYDVTNFVNGDHTVVLKFMAQYPRGYAGPMFASTDGDYVIGIGGYSDGKRLQLTVGGATYYFSGQNVTDDVVAGEWNSLAIVRKNGKYSVYLNAQQLSRDDCSSGCMSAPNGPYSVTGDVRLGRLSVNQQFYGFLDDVGVFGRALDTFEIWLMANITRMSGSESGLLRAWTFDSAMPSGDPHPPTVKSGTFVAPAYKALVSQARDQSFDEQLLPVPTVTVDLPFTKAHNWTALIGFNDGSHKGSAVHAWDFRRNTGEPETCGSSLVAAAAGEITFWYDEGEDLEPSDDDDVPSPVKDAYNEIHLEAATPGEYLLYMHVKTGSVETALDDLLPGAGTPPQVVPVSKGDKIGEAGTRSLNNCHLHFSYRHEIGDVTIPLGFRYELFNAAAGYWTYVSNGMPSTGDVIRKPQ